MNSNFGKAQPVGLSMLELVIAVAIISLLAAVVLIVINPLEMKQRGRDVLRIVDIASLGQAIESYTVDIGNPPDLEGVSRRSDVSVVNGQTPQQSNGQGWLGVDLSGYLPKLSTDPLNVWPNVYRYKRVDKKYEIDTIMEYYLDLMTSDNGNDSGHYERGTDLTIL